MTYSTILAQLQVGRGNDLLLETVRILATQQKAHVIGVAVAERTQRLHEEDYVLVANFMEQGKENVRRHYEAAEAEFRDGMQGYGDIEWRLGETFQSAAEYLAEEACGADLVVVNADQPLRPPMRTRPFDLAELVLHAGRPVLGVPRETTAAAGFARGMAFWKDTLESRRAIANALPVLKASEHVTLVEVVDGANRPDKLSAVARWLERQGVKVAPASLPLSDNVPTTLRQAVEREAPSYLVAGVFSHHGLRERLFGDVTKDMLRRIERCMVLSH